eukprot:g5271.t1
MFKSAKRPSSKKRPTSEARPPKPSARPARRSRSLSAFRFWGLSRPRHRAASDSKVLEKPQTIAIPLVAPPRLTEATPGRKIKPPPVSVSSPSTSISPSSPPSISRGTSNSSSTPSSLARHSATTTQSAPFFSSSGASTPSSRDSNLAARSSLSYPNVSVNSAASPLATAPLSPWFTPMSPSEALVAEGKRKHSRGFSMSGVGRKIIKAIKKDKEDYDWPGDSYAENVITESPPSLTKKMAEMSLLSPTTQPVRLTPPSFYRDCETTPTAPSRTTEILPDQRDSKEADSPIVVYRSVSPSPAYRIVEDRLRERLNGLDPHLRPESKNAPTTGRLGPAMSVTPKHSEDGTPRHTSE